MPDCVRVWLFVCCLCLQKLKRQGSTHRASTREGRKQKITARSRHKPATNGHGYNVLRMVVRLGWGAHDMQAPIARVPTRAAATATPTKAAAPAAAALVQAFAQRTLAATLVDMVPAEVPAPSPNLLFSDDSRRRVVPEWRLAGPVIFRADSPLACVYDSSVGKWPANWVADVLLRALSQRAQHQAHQGAVLFRRRL